MYKFRESTPSRRDNRAVCKHYTSYRDTLKEDFGNRCGYCNDLDKYRIRSYTIDHFVPQNPADFVHRLAPNDYYNLVYACRYCNSAKTNKWPTKDERVHHNGKEGFIDPVADEYTDMYHRSSSGRIEPKDPNNELAQYIIDELNLWKPIHERMWKIEKVDFLIDELEIKISVSTNQVQKETLEMIHYKLLKSWRAIQKGIFVENE